MPRIIRIIQIVSSLLCIIFAAILVVPAPWLPTFSLYYHGKWREAEVLWSSVYVRMSVDLYVGIFNLWIPFVFFAALLIISSLIHRVIRRKKCIGQRLCRTCSYDLRAHKPGQKCPECGMIIAPAERTG